MPKPPSLLDFFDAVMPRTEGWTPILTKDPFGNLTQFRWFAWPRQAQDMANYSLAKAGEDVYFSPFVYRRPASQTASNWARKENLLAAAVVWADGDDCPVKDLKVRPTVLVQTSQDHWQAYWRLDVEGQELSVFDWEALSRSLYLEHKDTGMDSGWHLAKKMRVPGAHNTKDKYGTPYRVSFKLIDGDVPTLSEFEEKYPRKAAHQESPAKSCPAPCEEEYPFQLLGEINDSLINDLFVTEPEANWSSDMYYLQCLLWEARVSLEDSFYVMRVAACNKFARDHRSDDELWVQMNRDYARWQETVASEVIDSLSDEALASLIDEQGQTLRANSQGLFWHDLNFVYDDEEVRKNTFVDIFTMWAQTRSQQSPRVFNEMGAVMLMASTMAKYAKIPLSFGDLGLNLFMMVLGQTTQSRKTTSLNMAKSLLRTITDQMAPADPADGEAPEKSFMAPEDSTPEALTVWLAERRNECSVFARDEVQDMFGFANEQTSYMRNMVPLLTKVYDGVVPAMLRRTGENLPAVPHYLTFYGTGIFNQAAAGLTRSKIESGFVPRCLIAIDDRVDFTPGADDVFLRKGRAAEVDDEARALLLTLMRRAIAYWDAEMAGVAESKSDGKAAKALFDLSDNRVNLDITPEAFVRWQRFAYDITRLAADHPVVSKELFPICERMAFSVLRVSGLLAMLDRTAVVRLDHVIKAASLANSWAANAEALVVEVCNNGLAQDIRAIESWLSTQPDRTAPMSKLLLKFQSRWDSLRKVQEVIQFAQARGTLKEIVTGKRPEDRYLKYVGE